MAATRARWQRARARAESAHAAWQAKADEAAKSGHRLPGKPPAPLDQQRQVRQAYDAYQQAITAARPGRRGDQPTPAQPKSPRANLTDPDSRLPTTRHGFIQGYNCMDAASEDQFILYAEVTQDTNDLAQFEPIMHGIVAIAADLATRAAQGPPERFTVGTLLADAGFNSDDNLTAAGPDLLIAQSKSRDLDLNAATAPTTGDPPPEASAHQRMNHRLRTPEGHQLYKRRSPLIEAPHGWLKDRRGLRRFSGRGLSTVRTEFRLAAAVTNLLRLRTLGITRQALTQHTT